MGKALDQSESRERKAELDRMAAMLSRLGGRGYCVNEEGVVYGNPGIDFDTDSDSDIKQMPTIALRGTRKSRAPLSSSVGPGRI